MCFYSRRHEWDQTTDLLNRETVKHIDFSLFNIPFSDSVTVVRKTI